MKSKIILEINAITLLILGISAFLIPSDVAQAVGLRAIPQADGYLRVVGLLLLVGAMLSWITSELGQSEAKSTILPSFGFAWVLASAFFLVSRLRGTMNDLAWGGVGIGTAFTAAFIFPWFSKRRSIPKFRTRMSRRELLIWLLLIIGAVTILFSVYIPFIWRAAYDERVPYPIINIANSAELILALVALGIGLAGAGIYRLISNQLTGEVKRTALVESWYAIARSSIDTGFAYWLIYTGGGEKSPDDLPSVDIRRYLRQAIRTTKRTLQVYCAYLDENEESHRSVILNVKNNFAYYAAELYHRWFEHFAGAEKEQVQRDYERAKVYADELEKEKISYPSREANWGDTIRFVRNRPPYPWEAAAPP